MKKIFFLVMALPWLMISQNKLQKYEYWFDADYANHQVSGISPTVNYTLNAAIPTAGLQAGLHVLHLRFQDDSLRWSSTSSQFFQKLPLAGASSTALVVAYEYWFDSNYPAHVNTLLTNQQNINLTAALSASQLNEGLHVLHLRVKDNAGKWSSVLSNFFYKTKANSNTVHELVAYQYWYDSNYNTATTVACGPVQNINILNSLNASSLNNGLHTLHIRFKDNTGSWSSVVSQFFHKSSATSNSTIEVTRYQYWFDTDYANAVVNTMGPAQDITLISSLSASALSNGLHAMHLRFADNTGKWSSVISNFFFKTGASSSASNTLVAYRYWFDQADTALVTKRISSTQNFSLSTAISMVTIPHGKHAIHFQFKDTLGMWSSVTNDTANKMQLPIASFTSADTLFCDSGLVHFTNSSIDADTYIWDFGDNSFSSLPNPSHQYNLPGLYTVKLTARDTSHHRDTIQSYSAFVKVYATPLRNLTVSANDSICAGNSATITAQANNIYSWSNGSSVGSITVNTAGAYYVHLANAQYTGCAVQSDTVHITVMPLPMVSLGNDTALCANAHIVLNAANAGATYTWSTGANTASINASASNSYWVKVVSDFGCVNQDTIHIGLQANPTAAFTYTVNGFTASFTNNSTAGNTYLWIFGDGYTSTNTSPIHTYSTQGTHTVALVTYNNCTSDTAKQVIALTNIYNLQSDKATLSIFPNPTSELINILFTVSIHQEVNIAVYDALGNLVIPAMAQFIKAGSPQTITIPVNALQNGAYFIRLQSSNINTTEKITVIR